jgi:hypothetical protein
MCAKTSILTKFMQFFNTPGHIIDTLSRSNAALKHQLVPSCPHSTAEDQNLDLSTITTEILLKVK